MDLSPAAGGSRGPTSGGSLSSPSPHTLREVAGDACAIAGAGVSVEALRLLCGGGSAAAGAAGAATGFFGCEI